MNQPFTYGELLAKHAKVSQDPEFKDISLPDYAAAMNEITGSQNYDQGLKDDFVRRASHKVDEAIDWTGLPQGFQSVGEGLTSMLGGGPEYQEAVGHAFRGLPRTLGEIGVGVGAAALATAAAPVAIPAGGIAAGGIALGTMAGLTGARTYGETGSVPQAGVSAATMLAGMKASQMVGQPILRAMGAPTAAEFAGKVAPEFAAKVGASFAPKEIGEMLVASNYPQQIARITGMIGSQVPVNELGAGISRRMQEGEWRMPTGPEFVASTASLLPFLGYDMVRGVQNPMRTFNKQVKPALQDSFVQRGVADYVAKHGEMPPDNQIAALAREAEILPPLTGPNFKIGDDGRFEAKFNSTAEATEWAQSHASRFDGFDLEARNGITYLKVKPKDVADFLELTGNNENNSFLESRNKSFTYQDAGAENVMATVMKYKQRFMDAVNEGKPEGQRISEIDLVDDELVRHISDAHRQFEQEQMAAKTKARPTQDDIINRAIKINTVETEFGRDLAVKIDPAYLAMEQESVARENQRAADLAADAEAVQLMNSDPAMKAKGEFASNWYEKERGVGARKETVMESGQHGRTTTATVGQSTPEQLAIDKTIATKEGLLRGIPKDDLFAQKAADDLRAEITALQEKRATLGDPEKVETVDEKVTYNEDGDPVNEKGEVIDENADEVITGGSYGANSGVRPATPGVSEALIRAAVKYPGQVIINPEGMPRDPSELAFTSYLQGTRKRAEAAYKAQDAQAKSTGIVQRFGADEASAKAYAEQRQTGRSEAEVAANVKFEAVKDKNGEWAVRALDQNAIRSFEGKWQTERGDWADTEMESMIAQFVGKLEEGAQVEVAAERGVHDLNDIRDPAIKVMRYQATVNNVASAMNDGLLHRELIRVLNLERNRKQDSELKKAKARVLQYIDFIRKGGNLTWKIVHKPAMREVFRTTDRAEAEQYIQDRLTQADVGKTIGSRGEGLTVRDYQFTTERAENNYNVLEEAIMNQFGDQVSVGYKVMEKPKDVVEVPGKGGKSGRRGFLTVELQGDLEGFNKQLLALSARTGVDYGGFVNEANADRSGRLNERRTNGLSPAEEILAALQAVGKQFQDPRKLYERPKGDFGFLPKPYWELSRDEKGRVTAHRLGLNDPETGAYIPAHEAVKTVKRGMDLAVPAGPGVMVKQRDGTMKEHKGNWATLVDDIFKSEGVVSFADFVSVMKQSLEKDRNAQTGPQIDHYNRVLDMLLNKGNERNWAPNIPVGVAMAKELGHAGPDGLINGVFGWYNHSRDTLQSTGMLLSPYYVHPRTGKVYQMSALEFLPHLIHEATHGNVAHGFDVDPVLKAQGIALVLHLKKQLKLDSAWASITGAEPRTISALRDPNREDYVSLQELAADLFTDESLMRTLRGMRDDPTLGGNPKPMNNLFNRVMDWIKSYLLKVFPSGKGESVVDGASLYDRLANYTARAMEVSDSRVRMEYKGDVYSAIAKEIFGSSRVDLLGSRRPEPSERTGDSGVGRVVGGKEPVKTAGLGWSRTIGDATRPKTAEDYTQYAKARNVQTKAEQAAADAERARIEADPNRPRRLVKVKQVEPTPSEELAKQRTDALRAELQKEYPDSKKWTIIVTPPEKSKSGLVSWEGGRVEVRSKTEYQPIPTVDLKGDNELPGVIRAQGKKTIPESSKNIEEDNGPQLIDQPLQFAQTIVQEGPAGERVAYTRVERPSGEFKMGAYREMISSVEGTEPVPAGPKSVPPAEKDRGPGLSAEDEAKVKARWPMGTSEVEGGLRSYIGANANVLNSSRLTAETMLKAGRSPEEVRQVTGWFKGKYDQKMRWEVPDNSSKLTGFWESLSEKKLLGANESRKLSEVFDHPALYQAYPELRDVNVTKQRGFLDFMGAVQGWYNSDTNTINVTPNAKDARSTLLHEIQHWIQTKEGFAKGSNTETAMKGLTLQQKQAVMDRIQAKAPELIKALEDRVRRLGKDIDLLQQVDPVRFAMTTTLIQEANARFNSAVQAKTASKTPETEAAVTEAYKEYVKRQDELTAVLGIPKNEKLAHWDYFYHAQFAKSLEAFQQTMRTKQIEGELDLLDQNEMVSTMHTSEEAFAKAVKAFDLSHELYSRVAGEIESRDVQARRDMSLDELDKVGPYSSEAIDVKDSIMLESRGLLQALPVRPVIGQKGPWLTPENQGLLKSLMEGSNRVVDAFMGTGKMSVAARLLGFQGQVVANEIHGVPASVLSRLTPELVTQAEQLAKQLEPLVSKPKEYNALVAAHPDKELARFVGSQANYMGRSLDKSPVHVPASNQAYQLRSLGKRLKAWLDSEISVTQGDGFKLAAEAQAGDFVIFDPPYVGTDTYRVNRQTDGLTEIAQAVGNGAKVLYFNAYSPELVKGLKDLGLKVKREQIGTVDTVVAHSAIETQALESRGGLGQEPVPATQFTVMTKDGPIEAKSFGRTVFSEQATGKGARIDNPNWKPESAPAELTPAAVKVKDGWLVGWLKPDGSFVTSNNLPRPTWEDASFEIGIRDTNALESRGPITVPEVTRALKHGTTAMIDKREESGRLWFKGEPFILGSVRPQKEGEYGWWSLSTKDLQRMAEELGTKEDLFANQVKSTPQITSAYPTLVEALAYQGMSKQEARKGALLIGRFSTVFRAVPGYGATVVGRSTSKDSLGFAWPSEGKVGLNPEAIADSANTTAGRFMLLREVFIHEMFHPADVKGTALAGIFDQLKTADARRDVLIASSYLNKGEFQGRTRQEAIEDSMEFSADLAANLVPSLLSGNPTAVMYNAATLLGPEVQQALFMEGIMHRKAMEIFSSKLAEKGQAEWAVPLTKEIQAYMKSFDEIQRDTEMFHVMRGLWPDAFMPEVMEVASQVETNGRRQLYAASKETLQESVLESRGMLRAEIGLSNNAKFSWWNKTLANFNRLADQFPILRPHWDMLHSASAQAQNATMDLKLIMAGQYQAGKYKSDARSKRWRQFNMTPRLLEAHDKLVMLANQMGDTANVRMTPLEQNTFLERSGKLTDPADRALVLEVFNAQLAQNEIVGGMINKAERHRDDVMLARLASKRGAGTVSLEQARAQGKLVGDWAEASFVGDIVTASDLANRMATEIPQDVRNEMVELAQALVTPRMEAYNTRQRGIGYWMPERRFGQWGLYYKDQNGDVQRHYFQQAKDLETFKARARVKDDDVIKLIGPAESEPNFGANPALFAALDEAQAKQVAAVRKHLGDAAADFLQKEGHFTAHVVGNLQAANPTSTSLKRTFGATRQFLTMSDVQQQYIEAAVNSIKNRTVQAENELILGDQSFAMQPESKILVRQHVDQFLKKDSEFGRKVQMANFVYFMGGNISSMVLEPFQQLMALAPVLTHNGAGLAGGYKLIADANALWAKAKMSGSFGNPDYDAAMKQWRQQGDADNGIYAELNHNEDLNLVNTIRQSGGFSQFSPYDLLKNKVYALANFATKFYLRVPAYNSEIALLASYKLLRSQGLPHEEATKQAVFLKEGAMFGGGKRNRPVGLFGFNRTAAQVMSSLQGYSLGMTSLMGQLIRESLGGKGSGLSPAQITQSRKAAAQMLMTQFAAAGALGMPFMAAALTGLQKMFPGTNPEQATRDFLDDFDKEDKAMGGVVGTFLAKGLPALMSNGPDMSSRFALGGVLGVNPYNGWTLANLAGPSVSLVTNIFNAGREAAMTGDPAALKPMMPIGLQKMYDAATQGSSFKDAKGRMLAEDLTGTEQVARFAGFTPNRVAETRDTTRLAKINESAARERTTRLANQLADLYQAGEVERVREKILDLEPHEQSTMVQAVASRLEQKTMPVDPRTIGSRMSLRSQQELFRLMQTGRVQLPTQQERMMLHGQVAMGLAIPGTQPPSNRSMGRAAAIDMLQQQSPALSKEAASLLLDRHSRLSPQARSDMFPGDTATGL